VTEADWDSCQAPQMMLEFLQNTGKASERKLRLFAVACCHPVWQFLKDERSRSVVEISESFADRAATVRQLRVAFNRAADAQEAIHWEGGGSVEQCAAEAVLGLRDDLQLAQVLDGASETIGEVVAGEAWERIY
jgi:hypothetical protein